MWPRGRSARQRCRPTPVDEFELIQRYFARGTDAPGVSVGIGDDGAVLDPSPDRQQVQVIDTLVEGVHFPPGTAPADIGYRAVAVNLSDVAAMGAQPRWMTLALTLPGADEQWIEAFARGLFEAASEFGVVLVGGDMTSGEQVVATVHLSGEVEPGQALLRSGAAAGDTIFVTGTLGDAAAGLVLLEGGDADNFLARRFLRPTARIDTGRQLAGRASAAIDVSDGLLGDLKKLLQASDVGAVVDVERVPLSRELRAHAEVARQRQFALTGGDDYELCFTAREPRLPGISGITAIGRITAEPGLQCRIGGAIVAIDDSGYRHFR
ncbi:MAG: thiamine-phosphate kinase [Gammaproteobacteria bacterium]|nr:thiamine-phosphate kinase [Gammaproteobacteria bacterium]